LLLSRTWPGALVAERLVPRYSGWTIRIAEKQQAGGGRA
jgi:hypothetical protein